MKFFVNVKKFLSTIQNYKSVASPVTFETSDRCLLMKVDDNGYYHVIKVPADIAEEGEFSVRLLELIELLRGLPEQPISFEINSEKSTIQTETGVFYIDNMICESADSDWESPDGMQNVGEIRTSVFKAIPEFTIKNPTGRVIENNYMFTSTHILSTDAHNLVYYRYEEADYFRSKDFFVPYSIIKSFLKSVPADTLAIKEGEDFLCFETYNGYLLVSKNNVKNAPVVDFGSRVERHFSFDFHEFNRAIDFLGKVNSVDVPSVKLIAGRMEVFIEQDGKVSKTNVYCRQEDDNEEPFVFGVIKEMLKNFKKLQVSKKRPQIEVKLLAAHGMWIMASEILIEVGKEWIPITYYGTLKKEAEPVTED